MADVGFADESDVFGDFEGGDVDWEGGVEEFEFAGGVADGGDSAADNELVAIAEAAGTGEGREGDAVAWGDEAAVAAPEVVDDGWDDTVVGVA